MSTFATQRERLDFLEKQIAGQHWIFNGPEERAIIRELAAVVKEQEKRIRELEKRGEETEG